MSSKGCYEGQSEAMGCKIEAVEAMEVKIEYEQSEVSRIHFMGGDHEGQALFDLRSITSV